jgi:glycyl-tRNA synthetase
LSERRRAAGIYLKESNMTEATPRVEMEKLVSLCQRRGFVFPSSAIYGGLSGFWDYGPLGIEMKRNIKDAWWRKNVRERDDVVGLETSIIMHPRVWEASGHVTSFSDPLVECKVCHLRWKADDLKEHKCPSCGGELTEERMFNTMFKSFVGPVEDEAAVVYLRPETAQGMFVDFEAVSASVRRKLPLGIAQQGRSFRNEITTGNFVFRCREFEQMEIEFFVKPGTDEDWFRSWVESRLNWYVSLGIRPEHLRLSPHPKEKLAHYAKACTDVEFLFPMGWAELEGIANRQNYDLTQHAKASGKTIEYFDDETKEHYVPFVIEPSAGVDRCFLALLVDAYREEPDKDETRVVLGLHPDVAPIKVAILPLSKKPNLAEFSRKIYTDVRPAFMTMYDETQSIGRRYRRQDEVGTPFCVTVDFQSLEDNRVTIRERDGMNQIRVPIATLRQTLLAKLAGEEFLKVPEGGEVVVGVGKG